MKDTKNLQELKTMDIKTLSKELNLANEKLAKMRVDLAFRKLKNIKQIQETRKRIARIWTILNQKATENIVQKEVVK